MRAEQPQGGRLELHRSMRPTCDFVMACKFVEMAIYGALQKVTTKDGCLAEPAKVPL